MNHAFYWAPYSALSQKARMYERVDDANTRTTGYWTTGYNEPGKWWAMGGIERIATCDTVEEARLICETTYNITGPVHVPR